MHDYCVCLVASVESGQMIVIVDIQKNANVVRVDEAILYHLVLGYYL